MGYKTLYQGGNGDFIDMKFSIDLIIETSEGIVKTLQVKSSREGAIKFYNEYTKQNRHRAVDILIFPKGDKFILYFLKDGNKKPINRKL